MANRYSIIRWACYKARPIFWVKNKVLHEAWAAFWTPVEAYHIFPYVKFVSDKSLDEIRHEIEESIKAGKGIPFFAIFKFRVDNAVYINGNAITPRKTDNCLDPPSFLALSQKLKHRYKEKVVII